MPVAEHVLKGLFSGCHGKLQHQKELPRLTLLLDEANEHLPSIMTCAALAAADMLLLLRDLSSVWGSTPFRSWAAVCFRGLRFRGLLKSAAPASNEALQPLV